ncbi:MAG: DUF3764 family protein [Rhizobiales bacterium]|nr:DUF3764 family protein [Hyphomicrobiales bacterium]
MITAVLKFEINNTFSEWEKAFYLSQSMAREAGIFEIYHGHEQDNDKKVIVVMNCLSVDHMNSFMAENADIVSASGHIIETTDIKIYVN